MLAAKVRYFCEYFVLFVAKVGVHCVFEMRQRRGRRLLSEDRKWILKSNVHIMRFVLNKKLVRLSWAEVTAARTIS